MTSSHRRCCRGCSPCRVRVPPSDQETPRVVVSSSPRRRPRPIQPPSTFLSHPASPEAARASRALRGRACCLAKSLLLASAGHRGPLLQPPPPTTPQPRRPPEKSSAFPPAQVPCFRNETTSARAPASSALTASWQASSAHTPRPNAKVGPAASLPSPPDPQASGPIVPKPIRSVRIYSTTLVRLLHGFVLLPSGILGTGNAML